MLTELGGSAATVVEGGEAVPVKSYTVGWMDRGKAERSTSPGSAWTAV
ncbi:hypothetical protein [Arthrobacter sp. W4I7]|nr:hypothetical protein [Arthrobacter sp. W4I7]MDQ0692142.1 hypothetical protein [Arthrobacter sp. W4I7]